MSQHLPSKHRPVANPDSRSTPQAEDWRERESAILALGAISEGCHRGLVPYIGELVGLLAPALGDARPLVRVKITHSDAFASL